MCVSTHTHTFHIRVQTINLVPSPQFRLDLNHHLNPGYTPICYFSSSLYVIFDNYFTACIACLQLFPSASFLKVGFIMLLIYFACYILISFITTLFIPCFLAFLGK